MGSQIISLIMRAHNEQTSKLIAKEEILTMCHMQNAEISFVTESKKLESSKFCSNSNPSKN